LLHCDDVILGELGIQGTAEPSNGKVGCAERRDQLPLVGLDEGLGILQRDCRAINLDVEQ